MAQTDKTTTSRTEQDRSAEEITDLRETIERLAQTVQCLTHAVDEMTVEFQWRNDGLRDRSLSPPPPFVLHDMPLDPSDPNWRINRFRPERAGQRTPATNPADSSERRRDVDQLCKELADLRQIVAALILIVSEGYEAMAVEIHDLIHGWATEEFDAEILHESLATYSAEPSTDAGVESRPASQQALFSGDEPSDVDESSHA